MALWQSSDRADETTMNSQSAARSGPASDQISEELPRSRRVILLLGGGVESTALLEQFIAREFSITPVHLLSGLWWEAAESAFIREFVGGYSPPLVEPLLEFAVPLTEMLPQHWSITGQHVPRAGDPSARLELPLRNLMLMGLALHQVRQREQTLRPEYQLAIGTTADNSFADGQRGYFDLCEQLLTREMGRPVRVLSPLLSLHKADVIRQSSARTLRASFSCVDPQQGQHCGRCIKCGSRHAAFIEAGVADPTFYVHPPRPSESARSIEMRS